MLATDKKPATWLVALLIFAWLACTAGIRPLFQPDEGRYVGVAWEMLRSGDWLVPTLNGLPFFHKPPLMYWLTASSLAVFGMNEWAARMAPMLGAWSLAFSMYLFASRWLGQALARRALLIALSFPMLLVGAQYANLDMLVAGCITATILMLAHSALLCENALPYKKALFAAYALAALAVLAKGLIGVVIPAGVIGLWLMLRGQWRVLWALMSLPGLLIFMAMAAPWFALMQMRFESFLDYFFVVQHFKRFTVGGFNNAMPFWFYFAVLGVLCLPWWVWVGVGMKRLRSEQGSIMLLMLIWLGFVLIFFSIPKSKLVGYVLPALAPVAILASAGVQAVGEKIRRWWLLSLAISAVAAWGMVFALLSFVALTHEDLSKILREQRQVGEPVYMWRQFYYNVNFYAQLKEPVRLIDDWSPEKARVRDNWRKELSDAGDFAPDLAKEILVNEAQFLRQACMKNVVWLMGSASGTKAAFPWLAAITPQDTWGEVSLWKIPRVSLNCEKTPSDGSNNKSAPPPPAAQ